MKVFRKLCLWVSDTRNGTLFYSVYFFSSSWIYVDKIGRCDVKRIPLSNEVVVLFFRRKEPKEPAFLPARRQAGMPYFIVKVNHI